MPATIGGSAKSENVIMTLVGAVTAMIMGVLPVGSRNTMIITAAAR